jgi:hypothetical protein
MSELNKLKESIESLSKFHQIEILKIFKKSALYTLNENKNGIFINMTSVDTETVVKLKNYLTYVTTQETHLNEIEDEKNTLTSIYFKNDKDNKDNNSISINANAT